MRVGLALLHDGVSFTPCRQVAQHEGGGDAGSLDARFPAQNLRVAEDFVSPVHNSCRLYCASPGEAMVAPTAGSTSHLAPEGGCLGSTSRSNSAPPRAFRVFARCGWCFAHSRAPQNENCCDWPPWANCETMAAARREAHSTGPWPRQAGFQVEMMRMYCARSKAVGSGHFC